MPIGNKTRVVWSSQTETARLFATRGSWVWLYAPRAENSESSLRHILGNIRRPIPTILGFLGTLYPTVPFALFKLQFPIVKVPWIGS